MVAERTELVKRSYVNIDVDLLYHEALPLEAKMLWCVLKQHAQSETGECWPGYTRLGELLGKSEKTVRAAMVALVSEGFVTRQRRGQGMTNLYTMSEPRTVNTPVQEIENGKIVAFRTGNSPVPEQSKTTDEVLTKEVLTKEVIKSPPIADQARTLISEPVFSELTKHLLVAGSLDDVDTVAEAIIAFPLVKHMLEARRCRKHWGSWHSKTASQRASLYAGWLVTAEEIRLKNAERFKGKPKQSESSSGNATTTYVRYDTPIKTEIPQFWAVYDSMRHWGTCTMKQWREMESLEERVADDGTLLFLVPDERREKFERLCRHDIDMACREHKYQFSIEAAS